MYSKKLRSIMVMALFALSLLAVDIAPAAAQIGTPVQGKKLVLQCTHAGNNYPVGTVLHYVLPYPEPTDLYMRCELKFSFAGGTARQSAQWVYYGSDPG